MRKRKNNKYLLLLILLLGITLGYALISTTLKINGTANVLKQTWNVYWDTPVVTEGSVSTTVPTRTNDEGDPVNTKLVWTVDLALPGDFYEFTVDAVNEGTIDAMITGINNTVTPALPEYIKYDVTYADGVTPAVNHLLAKNTTKKYKVRVYYDETVATASTINNMTSDTQYTFTFNVTYGQYTPTSEPEETWDTYYYTIWDEENNTYTYDQGTTTTYSDTWAFWARENSTKKQVCGKLANGPVCVEAPTDAEDMANIKNIMEENGASCMDSTNGYWCSFNSETLDNLYIHIEMYDDVKEVTFDDAQYTDGSHYCGVRADGTIGCD